MSMLCKSLTALSLILTLSMAAETVVKASALFSFPPPQDINLARGMSALENSIACMPEAGGVAITWHLARKGPARITVYSVSGRILTSLAIASQTGKILWRPLNHAPVAGVYIVRLNAGGIFRQTKLLVR